MSKIEVCQICGERTGQIVVNNKLCCSWCASRRTRKWDISDLASVKLEGFSNPDKFMAKQ